MRFGSPDVVQKTMLDVLVPVLDELRSFRTAVLGRLSRRASSAAQALTDACASQAGLLFLASVARPHGSRCPVVRAILKRRCFVTISKSRPAHTHRGNRFVDKNVRKSLSFTFARCFKGRGGRYGAPMVGQTCRSHGAGVIPGVAW